MSGDFGDRARGVLAAGCDLALTARATWPKWSRSPGAVGEISAKGRERLDRAMATVGASAGRESYADLAAKRDTLLGLA